MERAWVTFWAVVVLTSGLAGCLGAGDRNDQLTIAGPVALVVDDVVDPRMDAAADGSVWLAAHTPGDNATVRLWRIDDGRANAVALPGGGRGDGPPDVVVGPDGAVHVAHEAPADEVDRAGVVRIHSSTDGGETWTTAHVPTPTVDVDRVWLAAEPSGALHVAIERVDVTGTVWHAMRPGGTGEWTDPRLVSDGTEAGSGLAVDPATGELHMVRLGAGDGWLLYTSSDGGATWHERAMFDHAGPEAAMWRPLLVLPSGVVAFVTAEGDGGAPQVELATSADGGSSWTRRVLVGSGGFQMLPWADTWGPAGLVAAWYEQDPIVDPFDNVTWHLRVAHVDDVTSTDARLRTALLGASSDHDAPVHEGRICPFGSSCGVHDRRVGDVLAVTTSSRGGIHLAFVGTSSGPSILGTARVAGEALVTDRSMGWD